MGRKKKTLTQTADLNVEAALQKEPTPTIVEKTEVEIAAEKRRAKRAKIEGQGIYGSEQEAMEAAARLGRKAYRLTLGDRVLYAVAGGPHHAGYLGFTHFEGTIDSIGRKPKASRLPDVAKLTAAEREELLSRLQAATQGDFAPPPVE